MKNLSGLIVMSKKRTTMFLLLTVASLLTLLPMSAMAGTKNSANVSFSDPVVISGTHLKAGDYTVRWNGTGSDVQVQVMQDKKELATVPAKLITQHNDRSPVIVTSAASDGSTTIKEIGLSNVTLRFSE